MSKPSPGSVAHPHTKPHQSPATPKIRSSPPLAPRINQSRSLPRLQRNLPSAGTESQEAQKAAEAANSKTLWETIIRRKKLVFAIGIGITVVAGSLLGARIKESRQDYGRRQELEETARRLAESSAVTATTTEIKTQESTVSKDKSSEPMGVTQAVAQQSSAYSVDIARQITLLEDRKAILNRQKANYEQKIQRLRERQTRKQEMEARRPQPVRVDR